MDRRGQSLTLSFIFKGSSLLLVQGIPLSKCPCEGTAFLSSGTIIPQRSCFDFTFFPGDLQHPLTHLFAFDLEMIFKGFMLVLICFLGTETRVAFNTGLSKFNLGWP